MTEIAITNLSFFNLTLLGKTLDSALLQEKEISLDLRKLPFCKPEQILHLALILKDFKRRKKLPGTIIIDNTSNITSYLSHIGFFDLIDLPYGKNIGAATGSNTYVPIKELNKRSLLNTSFETGESLQKLIQFEAEGLTRVLLGSSTRTANFLIISYSIREAIRNALEHSEQDICYICGQKWGNGQSQITVVDEGIGIYESFRRASIDNVSVDDCLENSIKPGFSRTANLSVEQNVHDNSGYGLYVLYEIAKNYGQLTLSSSNKLLSINRDKIQQKGDSLHPGTLLSLTFNAYPGDASDLLDMIIESGEEEALLAGRKKSSRRSKSLISD